jgi:hypothetical protein
VTLFRCFCKDMAILQSGVVLRQQVILHNHCY